MRAGDPDAHRVVLNLAGSLVWTPRQAQVTAFTLFHSFGSVLATLRLLFLSVTLIQVVDSFTFRVIADS